MLQLDAFAPHHVLGLHHGGVTLGVPGLGLHTNEDQLLVRVPLDAPPPDEATDSCLDTHCCLIVCEGHAHARTLVFHLALPLQDVHHACTLACLPPPLIALDDGESLLLRQGESNFQSGAGLWRSDIVLLHQRFQELVPVIQLLGPVLNDVLGHRHLQHIRAEFQVYKDVVQADEVQPPVELHHPVPDFEHSAHTRLHSLPHV
mmetsp:Transcript_17353/g.29703  ORF Transcript_17353/g.29703 Transcript_17353/m.29703 type:complete len:203 (-) Transcript_17353:302-910(-)